MTIEIANEYAHEIYNLFDDTEINVANHQENTLDYYIIHYVNDDANRKIDTLDIKQHLLDTFLKKNNEIIVIARLLNQILINYDNHDYRLLAQQYLREILYEFFPKKTKEFCKKHGIDVEEFINESR